MTSIQAAAVIFWAYYTLGAIIHVNVESAMRSRNVGHADPHRYLGVAELITALIATGTGAALWAWIA